MAKKKKSKCKSIHKRNAEFWSRRRLNASQPRRLSAFQFPQELGAPNILSDQPSFQSSEVPLDLYNELPYSAVGKLVFMGSPPWACNAPRVEQYGSAWSIGRRAIMTVAHNIFDTNCREFSTNIVFIPGANDLSTPELYSVIGYRFPDAYPDIPSANNDVAVCILDRDLDADVGETPPLVHQPLEGDRFLQLGYPSNHSMQNMWQCDGEFAPEKSSKTDRIVMGSDFGGGSSGGPWLVQSNGNWFARGHQVGPFPGQAGDFQGSSYYGDQVEALLEWAGGASRVV